MYPFKQAFNRKPDGGIGGGVQWPLNQAAYQNVANDEVDWAALAQQWIYMKETCPYEGMPEAPPPPKISKSDLEEKGEAPMEVEKDDEQIDGAATFSAADVAAGQSAASFSDPQSGWNSGWNPNWRKKPGWNTWTNPNLQNAQGNVPTTRQQQLMQNTFVGNNSNNIVDNKSDGYWTSNQRFSNRSQTLPNNDDLTSKTPNDVTNEQFQAPLDAAKRKTLPAWIRQGLEKMEREKQKSAEKEREAKERQAQQEQSKNISDRLNAIGDKIPEPPTFSTKSKFDSESDSDDDAKETKYQSNQDKILSPKIEKIQHKSKQEQLQDLMLLVRGTLTEILLDVTNEEIKSIAGDTLAKMRSKAKKAKPVRKTALSSLTGGLGLGIYADSDNSSSDESNDENHSDNDSDAELKEIIKRRKVLFESKAREIEANLAMEEERDRRRQNDVVDNNDNDEKDEETKSKSDRRRSKEIGEVQHENNFRSQGDRRDKKTTRFSDPSDTVKNLHVTHGSIIYESVANSVSKVDHTTGNIPTRANSYYDNNKDSDSSSSSSNKSRTDRRKRSHNSSSGDSDNDKYRKRYRSREKSHRRSRSTSSERKYRSHSYKSYRRTHSDRGASSTMEPYKSSRERSNSRSYSNSSSRDSYNRKRSRSRSPYKNRKYY